MAGFPRGRGMSREDSRLSAGPNPSRPVPITWTPNPESQQAYTPNPARVFRRATAVVASPAPGTPSVTTEPPVVVPTAAPVPSLIRGRGATRGRPRPRAHQGGCKRKYCALTLILISVTFLILTCQFFRS